MNYELERKWNKVWDELRIYYVDADPEKPKKFVTFPIPYMNGPLHLGHAYTISRADAYARYFRLKGYNVLFPQAWHWTGQPIVSAAERLAKGDENMIKEFKQVDKLSDDIISRFKDPLYMANYYTQRNKDAINLIGIGIDWRREFKTTSNDPWFSKFVEWQFNTLRDRGYITKGSHPVVWCPRDKSPVGDHDRLKGEGVFPVEFRLILFKMDDGSYLVASTIRPETIFGATNIWIHPELDYVKAEVNGQTWIIGENSVERLEDQLFDIHVIERFKGNVLLGKKVTVPVIGTKIPILPATFIDSAIGTEVVYSVPSHAPYDYLALRDLQTKGDPIAIGIKPISIIEVEGHGDSPAVEIVQKMKIKDQEDVKAEEATREIYSLELRKGKLKGNCGKYAGMPVNVARGSVFSDLKSAGLAASMYDLPEPVICRCTTRCHVKILQDQWFLKYSDSAWKDKAKECINEMNIYPEEARNWFLEVVDWLLDYPCARQSGLGTHLPWDNKWLIETLSDSTVYMAFYSISHIIRKFPPERLEKDVFDYIFYGSGNVTVISEHTGIDAYYLKKMRDEFVYWYPVDMRVSAKELVPNHLTFFIFHHVALFDSEKWPRGISVNGMLRVDNEKMSKSKGNLITIEEAVRDYGADAVRAALLISSEYMDDANWKGKLALSIKEKLERILLSAGQHLNDDNEKSDIYDRWMLNRISSVSQQVGDMIENMNIKGALQIALFDMDNYFKQYLKMKQYRANPTVVKTLIKAWSSIVAPFMPYFAEELYKLVGNSKSIIIEGWPKGLEYEERVDLEIGMTLRLVNDIREILRVIKVKPKKITVFAYDEYSAAELTSKMKTLTDQKRIAIEKLINSLPDLQKKYFGIVDEVKIYTEHLNFIKQETGIAVQVKNIKQADQLSSARTEKALPMKPAILIEKSN
ncbi:MAG: leucine--tRNA ligase [Conexivisphaerales archaeon]